MPNPKPVTLTQIDAADYEGAGDPQPLVIVGDVPAGTPQAAIANAQTYGTFTILEEATNAVNDLSEVINDILAALRSAGIIAS